MPSTIAVCLPMLQASAAAEAVTVPDGTGTWSMTISPVEVAGAEDAPILLAAYQEDTEFDGAVPDPVEPVPAESDAPEYAPKEDEDGEPLPTVTAAPMIDPAAYWHVYRTIPFIRTEYLANPSYRHEATMEFLFGQLRPTVVHKHQQAAPIAPLVRPAPIPPYVYDRYLGQIPTFIQRYRPPAIPFGGYPLSY